MKYPDSFIRLLSKLEYNNYIYLTKLADRAKEEGHQDNLVNILNSQAKEEKYHGKVLSALVDGISKLRLKDNGYFKSLISEDKSLNYTDYKDNSKTVKVIWFSQQLQSKVTGEFVNLDGVSKRYISSYLLFRGKTAFSYDWADQLALMSVLEEQTTLFYKRLSVRESSPLQRISLKFANQEDNHYKTLYYALTSFTATPNYYMDKWKARLFFAKIGLIIDIIIFTITNIKYARR